MKCRRLTAVLPVVAFAATLLLPAEPARGADRSADQDLYGAVVIRVTDYTIDGQVRVSERVVAAGPDGILPRVSAPQIGEKAAPSARIVNTIHWPLRTKINYLMTQYFKDQGFRNRLKAALAKYGNKRRGTKTTPTQFVSKKTTSINPIESFANPNDFYNQTLQNGKNEILMTADDQFFRDPFGVFFDPDVVIRSIVMTFGQFSQQGGKLVGTLGIVEADVLIRSDFFGLAKFVWQLLACATFHNTLGYPSTIWTHDILGVFHPYVTEAVFNNFKSAAWALMMQRDMDNYPANLIPFAPAQAAVVPFVRPPRHTLLSIGEDIRPKPDPFRAELVLPVFWKTDLVAPNKKMTAKISWVEKTATGEKLHKIGVLAGKMVDWPIKFQGNTFYPTVFHNTITVKDNNKGQLRFDAMQQAVDDHGKPMTIVPETAATAAVGQEKALDPISWNKVLEIEVVIKGLDTQDGFTKAQRTVKERYYIVNSDNENVPN